MIDQYRLTDKKAEEKRVRGQVSSLISFTNYKDFVSEFFFFLIIDFKFQHFSQDQSVSPIPFQRLNKRKLPGQKMLIKFQTA